MRVGDLIPRPWVRPGLIWWPETKLWTTCRSHVDEFGCRTFVRLLCKPPKVTLRDIEYAVCLEFGVLPEALKRGYRHEGGAAVFRPRQVASYLARKMTDASFPQIGAYFGRHHSTIISAVRRIEQLIPLNENLAERVENCRTKMVPATLRRCAEREDNIARLARGEVSWPLQR